MALKHLQPLVQRVAAIMADNATGLEGKFRALGIAPAFLSYPRHSLPSYPLAESDVRSGRGGAEDCGTAQAVARAGRPGCWASVPRQTLARNPRGTIQSRWSQPLAPTATRRPVLGQTRMTVRYFGADFMQG